MVLILYKSGGEWLRRAKYGGDWALTEACCCKCCCPQWPANKNDLIAIVTGDIEFEIPLEYQGSALGCMEWRGSASFIPWDCIAEGETPQEVDLQITVLCPLDGNGPEDVQVGVLLKPSNQCGALYGMSKTDPNAVCDTIFAGDYHFDWVDPPGEDCLCSYGIDVYVTEDIV